MQKSDDFMHEKVKMLKNCQIMQKNAIFAEKRDFAKKREKMKKTRNKTRKRDRVFRGSLVMLEQLDGSKRHIFSFLVIISANKFFCNIRYQNSYGD